MEKILIIVKSGTIQEIISTTDNLDIYIKDYDILEENEVEERDFTALGEVEFNEIKERL